MPGDCHIFLGVYMNAVLSGNKTDSVRPFKLEKSAKFIYLYLSQYFSFQLLAQRITRVRVSVDLKRNKKWFQRNSVHTQQNKRSQCASCRRVKLCLPMESVVHICLLVIQNYIKAGIKYWIVGRRWIMTRLTFCMFDIHSWKEKRAKNFRKTCYLVFFQRVTINF